ncbi:MAG: CAP domain-containing protein [Candidatus Dormibacteria bacterium]
MKSRGIQALAAIAVGMSTWGLIGPQPVLAASPWLTLVNEYRASAGLPPVAENTTYSAGDLAHAQYLVQNNAEGHDEDPSKPGYSPQGAAAGQASDVVVDFRTTTTDADAINLWMTGPFHSIGIVDPKLQEAGFGSYRAAGTGVQMAAALNVITGRVGTTPPGTRFPVIWPGDGSSVPLSAYTGNESPDPLTSCQGYAAPTGLPILLEMGQPGAAVTSFSLLAGSVPVDSCEFDATNYANPSAQDQSEGRALLGARGAVVLIPRAPLKKDVPYTVSETVSTTTYTWTFRANSSPPGASTPLGTQVTRTPATSNPAAKQPRRPVPPIAAIAIAPVATRPAVAAVDPPLTLPPLPFVDNSSLEAATSAPAVRAPASVLIPGRARPWAPPGRVAAIGLGLALMATVGAAWAMWRRRTS